MFKKFKDKLAEEMKQSPARLQASMQQLAQAVSPALSNSSIQEMSGSNDNFSLTEDGDETPKNTPTKHSFQNVDLISPSANRVEISRRSSVSSINSDTSSLFPVYESPQNLYHIQSDMDQSASEVDDNISPHLDRVTKDQLYSAYRKVQTKYHKYRGRYTDLATHYRELDRVKSKLESVLVETQDKVLRRVADLKEQCQLEQQAKAHLEEALRNDIEEKDHIINTLNTKVKLLQTNESISENPVAEDSQNKNSKVNLIDLANESSANENNALSAENIHLKDKLKRLEVLIFRYKESLKNNKEKFTETMKEKNILENNYETLKNSTTERISVMEDELNVAQTKIQNLTKQVNDLHKREEESAISLAENKLSVHRELEEKEEQIKQLKIDLKNTIENQENSNEIITRYKSELGKLKLLLRANPNLIAEMDTTLHDMSKENVEAVLSMQQEEGVKNHEEVDHIKEIPAKSEKSETSTEGITFRLKEKETELQELQYKIDELEKHNVEYKHDRETLQAELSNYKLKCSELKSEYDAQRIITEQKKKDAEATIEKLQATVQSVDKELENMRGALVDRDQVCENYNKKVQQYAAMFDMAKNRLIEQDTEITSLKDRVHDTSELFKIQEELKNKKTELNVVQGQLEVCKSTIDDLKNKVQVDNSAISLLKKERGDLINHLVYYKDCIQRLKQDFVSVKSVLKEDFSTQNVKLSDLNTILAVSLTKLGKENITLTSKLDELRNAKIKDLEECTSKEAELNSIISMLETELKESNERLKVVTTKSNQYDAINIMNSKLLAEIDNLNFKIYDLEKISGNLIESQQEVKVLQERLKVLENNESVNHTLSMQVDDLNTKLREANNVITLLKTENSDHNALHEELPVLKSEIDHLRDNLVKKEDEIKTRDERIANDEEQIMYLKSTCDSHIQTIEEHVRKYLNLEKEYQTTRDNHAKQTTELMENNKALQDSINVKLVQLKKMKIIKERQSKAIEEMKTELSKLKIEHVELSNMLENSEKQIESLITENSQLETVTLENFDLKDKQDDLIIANQKLCESEEALKQRIQSHETHIEILQKDIESYKSQLDSRNKEIERLNNEATNINMQLKGKNTELDSSNERLLMNEKELYEIKEKVKEQSYELQTKLSELNAAVTNDNITKEKNGQLLAELKLLKDEIKKIECIEDKNVELKSELNDLIQKNSDIDFIRLTNNELISEQTVLKNKIAELEIINSDNVKLQTHVNNLESKIFSLEALRIENDKLLSEINTLRQSTKNTLTESNTLENLLTEKNAEIKILEDKNSGILQQIENLKLLLLEAKEKTEKVDTVENSTVTLLEEKIVSLQSEIDSLVQTNDTLQAKLQSHNAGDTKCQSDSNKLQTENKRLEAQLDEALITFQAKESQMQIANNELKAQANQLREQLKTNEEEQGMRLKQLVKEFQAQLHDKEEELQAALEKRFDRQHNYESNLVQQYKEQLKDFQVELTEKSEQIESLVLEKKDVVAEKGKDIDRLVETIAQIKKEHANEIKEVEKKWKAIIQQRIDNLQTKHEEEINELTKEWQDERKLDTQTETPSKELESTSRVAMAAVQTNTGSIHTLQQTLTSQRRELMELRKLVRLRHDTLEDSTEIEYLRNILFEYMMGRETMVLARVIAAVVKFDQEQTTKILKKEEDKLTLFGSLGLT